MKYILITIFTAFSLASLANEKTTVKITSLTNGARSTVLEACGTATHIEGKKTLLVTAKHDESYYTTLTNPDGKWCVLILRWTNKGEVDATATTLTGE
jgi:hypothetical protein